MKSFVRITALLWADVLVAYALFVMQDYLTSVWQISFTSAAEILNIWGGLSMVLPLIFLFLVDALLGNFMMLVISSIAYSAGIGCVAMSTPTVFPGTKGTCKQYKKECIGHTEHLLFYTGMALIAVGVAGHLVSLKPFLEEQKDRPDDEPGKAAKQLFGFIVVAIIPIVGAFALPNIKPWSIRFGIPAICTLVATLLFFSGWCTYYKATPRGSPLTNVEEAKIIVRMIPMWMTFIVVGIVSSTGNTYFIEQARNMNRKLGAWKVPLSVFKVFLDWTKESVFAGIANSYLPKSEDTRPPKSKDTRPLKGIAMAMIFSVLCCITAALVERKRVNVIIRHGLLNEPNKQIPMSMCWLLFQFFLLGAVDAFFEKSIEAFYESQAPESMRSYLSYFTKGKQGLGFMCSVLSVYVVGELSKKGGKPNWFQYTLNGSRLDRYYWVLAALSAVNLVIFILVALTFGYKNYQTQDERNEELD